MKGCYLLHFDPPYRHAQHYLGCSDNVERRVREHLSCGVRANPLVRAAIEAGCTVTLARVWPELGRTDERRMKQNGHRWRCPICKAGRTCKETMERARHDRAIEGQLAIAA